MIPSYLITSVVHLYVITIHIDMLVCIVEHCSYGYQSHDRKKSHMTEDLPGLGFLALHAMSSASIKMMLL